MPSTSRMPTTGWTSPSCGVGIPRPGIEHVRGHREHPRGGGALLGIEALAELGLDVEEVDGGALWGHAPRAPHGALCIGFPSALALNHLRGEERVDQLRALARHARARHHLVEARCQGALADLGLHVGEEAEATHAV